MDPNANLMEQEELIREMAEYGTDTQHPAYINAKDDLQYLRSTLHEWLHDEGGFEPDWSKAPRAARYYGKL